MRAMDCLEITVPWGAFTICRGTPVRIMDLIGTVAFSWPQSFDGELLFRLEPLFEIGQSLPTVCTKNYFRLRYIIKEL